MSLAASHVGMGGILIDVVGASGCVGVDGGGGDDRGVSEVGVGVLAWLGDGGGSGKLMFASQSLLLSEASVAAASHLHVARLSAASVAAASHLHVVRLSSLSLLKTMAFASSHVGIVGSAGSAQVGVAVVVGCNVCAGKDGDPFVIGDGIASCDTWLLLPETLPPHIFCSDTSVSSHTLRMRGCRRNFVASVAVP